MLMAPKNLDGQDTDNHVANMERSFEMLCTSMEELGVESVHTITVFQFYAKIRYFKKKQADQKAANQSKR